MIKNDRQLSVTQRKLDEIRAAQLEAKDLEADVLEQLATELEAEIAEYVEVRDGVTNVFHIDSVDHLAHALIKARISRRWTQAQLAEKVGVSEQMIQADEAGGYERAGLARLAEVADALEYNLRGELVPTFCAPSEWFRQGTQESSSTSRSARLPSSSTRVLGFGAVGCNLADSVLLAGFGNLQVSWATSAVPTSASTSRNASTHYETGVPA